MLTPVLVANVFTAIKVPVLFGEDAPGSASCDPTTAHLRAHAYNNVVWDLLGGTNTVGSARFDSGFLSWAAYESTFVHNTVFSVTGSVASATISANNLSNLPHRSCGGGALHLETNTIDAAGATFVVATQAPPNLAPSAPAAPGIDLSSDASVRQYCSEGTLRHWPTPSRGALEFVAP